jgi:phenylacetate-coenzyme A ligase PaaK-like adenylate-forming protein
MTTLASQRRSSHASETDKRLERALLIHFDPDHGTPFWLDRQAALGIDARRAIRSLSALELLGEMTPKDLTGRPLRDYIPRRFHDDLAGFVVGQTGGTTGGGVWTMYRPDEFAEAFITPFAVAAAHVGFPRGERWMYIGPSGPHIIGKVVRSLSGCLGGHDPFSVDFDARWAKKLPHGSFAIERYLSHVIDQSMAVIDTQDIGVLFTTPAVLGPLADAMSQAQRQRIRGVHYGGMEVDADALSTFQGRLFPNAVHLSGYGNTLFGCCLELNADCDRIPEYFPYGARLVLEVVDANGRVVPDGEVGTVRFTRLDESFLIVRMLERDAATRTAAPDYAPAGFVHSGVRNPHSPASLAPRQARGLY